MAWRIGEQVQRGELDNRTRGRVTGRLWLLGRAEPVELDLEGNPWRDLAGQRFEFVNPTPKPQELDSFASLQQGVAGDITASRKVRVPDGSTEDFQRHCHEKTPYLSHWANSFHFEWFSDANGRVVIEAVNFELKIDPEPAWAMTEGEEVEQRRANGEAMLRSMQSLGEVMAAADFSDEDASPGAIEAAADAEDARMNLLLDRIDARLKREGREDWAAIFEEERERLRRERGEPKPEPLTPEQEAERQAWVEEMNAAGQEALEQAEADRWKDTGERRQHPLVERCGDLSLKLHRSVEKAGWLKVGDHEEHPIREILSGVMIAGPKLAGALNAASDEDAEWPPDPLFAGQVLVRLKKGRNFLEDALRGVECAEAQRIASPEWLTDTRREIDGLLAEVRRLIDEVRQNIR